MFTFGLCCHIARYCLRLDVDQSHDSNEMTTVSLSQYLLTNALDHITIT